MAVASRSPTADIADIFLNKLSIKPIFRAQVSPEKQYLFASLNLIAFIHISLYSYILVILAFFSFPDWLIGFMFQLGHVPCFPHFLELSPDRAGRVCFVFYSVVWLQDLILISFLIVQEIFSSWTHKTDHFQRIHSRTGVPFNSMLFFDDENRNIQAVKMASLPYFLFCWRSMQLLHFIASFLLFF